MWKTQAMLGTFEMPCCFIIHTISGKKQPFPQSFKLPHPLSLRHLEVVIAYQKWITLEFCGLDFRLYFSCDLKPVILWCLFQLQMLREMQWLSSLNNENKNQLDDFTPVSSRAFSNNGQNLMFSAENVFDLPSDESLLLKWAALLSSSGFADRWHQYCLSWSTLLV